MALTQKGFTQAEVLALSEPEAASLIELLTDNPRQKSTERFIPKRQKKRK